jgi:N-acetylglucosamine kinase-like BadF-type ATPase
VTVVLGVDGGGSKTHAVVADTTGAVHGFATSGGSNWEMVGLESAGAAVGEAAAGALRDAGVSPNQISASVFGLAGLDWDSDLPGLERAAVDPLGLAGPRAVVNDAFIALRAGTSRPWGVVVIAGPGTVAAGRNHAGEVFRTLGLGPEFGDWGSASDVALEAVRAVARAYTGAATATILTDLLCERVGARTVAELLERLSRTELDVQGVAPLVTRAAEAGDAVARDIVERAGSALGDAAALVARRLGIEDDQFEVVLAGGLFRSTSPLLEGALEVAVRRVAHRAVLLRLDAPPVVGAALMAMELTESEVVAGVHHRLAAAIARAQRAAA